MPGLPSQLVLVRHAKAEAFAEDDHARPLTDRGRRAAAETGRWLAAHGVACDQAYVSSALRARQTWEALADSIGGAARVVVDESLYSAGPEAALSVLRGAPPGAGTVLCVGHNPTMADLAHLLDDGEPDPEAFREMTGGYPAASATILEVPVAWEDLGEGSARITGFHVGTG